MEWLINLDRAALIFINSLNTPMMDKLMWLISGKFTWVPLYLGMAYYAFKTLGWKQGLMFLLFAILLITAIDQSSVAWFKNVFCRYRPTHNLDVGHLLHIVNDYKGGRYGFVSSHAANSFGIAVFTALVFSRKYYTYGIIAWAAAVSYSRMYLGVHYPADIIGGALLGAAWAYLAFYFWKLAAKCRCCNSGN
jgi:undecaprenyl-diphosphatase